MAERVLELERVSAADRKEYERIRERIRESYLHDIYADTPDLEESRAALKEAIDFVNDTEERARERLVKERRVQFSKLPYRERKKTLYNYIASFGGDELSAEARVSEGMTVLSGRLEESSIPLSESKSGSIPRSGYGDKRYYEPIVDEIGNSISKSNSSQHEDSQFKDSFYFTFNNMSIYAQKIGDFWRFQHQL